MNSVAATGQKAALASPATARASSVLPQPGGPDEQEAAREARADLGEAVGVAEVVLDLGAAPRAPRPTPATSANVTRSSPSDCWPIVRSRIDSRRWRSGASRIRVSAASSSACEICVAAGARGEQRRLVDDALEVGAGHADGARARSPRRSTSGASGLPRACTREDRRAAVPRRAGRATDRAVEAARPQQRRVEVVGPVGRADDDRARRRREAVHLGEQLVERLLLLVARARRRALPERRLRATRVDLVDEHDRGRVLARLAEQLAHARGADADVHLDEVRARRSSRTRRPTRRRAPAPAASCRSRAARTAARPWGCARRGCAKRSGSTRNCASSRSSVTACVLAGDVVERQRRSRRRRTLRAPLRAANRPVPRADDDDEVDEDDDEDQRRQQDRERRAGSS